MSLKAANYSTFKHSLLAITTFIADLASYLLIYKYTKTQITPHYLTMNETPLHLHLSVQCMGLTLNSYKTQAIIFTLPKRHYRDKRNPSKLSHTLNHTPSLSSKNVTYLEFIRDHQLINEVTNKANNLLNLLRGLTGIIWGLKLHTVINMCKAFLRPTLTYGFTA